jgi:hypothetical protein
MKTTLLVFGLFTAVAAFGQSSLSASSMTPSFQVAEHPGHASLQPMTQEQSLLSANSVTIGHGEMPLWEAMPEHRAAPLGDQARLLKKEHDADKKKSHCVWVN